MCIYSAIFKERYRRSRVQGKCKCKFGLKVVKDFWEVFQGAASVFGNNQQFCYEICNEKNYISLG